MLQLFKNDVITQLGVDSAGVRQAELDFYTNNYWTWGSCSTVFAGFLFAQLTNPVPEGTNFWLETAYLVFTALCLGLNLCIITWTCLCCMWGPGMALRGPHGLKSFHRTIDFLKGQQTSLYWCFNIGVTSYFGSSCTLVWVYPSRTNSNLVCTGTLILFFIVLLWYQWRLSRALRSTMTHANMTDGRIAGFAMFEGVADLDLVAARVGRGGDFATTRQRGMYDTSA